MLDEMCAILGGRAAEELFVGRISTGAMNDLERVTKQAYGMIAYAGMGDRLPNLCYYNTQEQFHKPYSEKTAELIDNEVKALIAEQYERAKRMLLQYSEGHRELAELLMEREVIFAEDAERIFGKRQWASRSEEILEPAVENTEKSEKASKRASKKAKSADSVAVGQTEEEKIASEVAAEPVADSVKTAEVESPNVSEPQTASEPSAAPVLTESPDYSKPAKPKSERTRKPKDENLFDGFDFDQEKTE
jgi:cell division protease FtsH